MTDNELKNEWKKQGGSEQVAFTREGLAQELQTALAKMDSTIKRRNTREVIAAYALIPAAIIMAIAFPPLVSKIGALLLIPCSVLIITVLKRVQRYKTRDMTLPLKDYLVQCKIYLEKERYLLNKVAYWYLGPLLVCLVMIFAGQHRHWLSAGVLPMFVVIYYLNRKAAKEYFGPVLEKINADIATLTSAGINETS